MTTDRDSVTGNRIVAICGNPNSGKTSIFNAITGLNQKVGNYPGVTVEKVSGLFRVGKDKSRKYELMDVPGTYSLAAFSPDEYIAASALSGGVGSRQRPAGLICVVDATNLQRSLYLLLQVMQIGCPVAVALNMIDLAERRGIRIDYEKLSQQLGGLPVVPVVGNRGRGIERLKEVAASLVDNPVRPVQQRYDEITEGLIEWLAKFWDDGHRTRAEYLRVIFDVNGPAERRFLGEFARRVDAPDESRRLLDDGRAAIKQRFGSLSVAETGALTEQAARIFKSAVSERRLKRTTRSERLDRVLLHPVAGPVLLIVMMTFVFQYVFSLAEPFMYLIDRSVGALASYLGAVMIEGPLRSLVTDGVIGGVGSVLIFLPQIIILFLFIAVLEDSGYMVRAAFIVDRMFRWCGLSGKSFIPMLSSFACAVPGIMATRTIEDRKLRFITIMVAPLMTCSARLPVYAIMIAAFIPHRTYLGLFNLQGLVLATLYLLGIVVAVVVSLVLQKTVLKTERGTFMMEMPSYKLPMLKSVVIRVINRARLFLIRAGTVILAITIVVWALSYYPHSEEIAAAHLDQAATVRSEFATGELRIQAQLDERLSRLSQSARRSVELVAADFARAETVEDLAARRDRSAHTVSVEPAILNHLQDMRRLELERGAQLARMANERAGAYIRDSYLGSVGRIVEPLFLPLGWDWRITVATLSSFPAREIIIATIGTIYNLGTDVEESSNLIDKMRQARWESGPKQGNKVFSVAVALSIMVFFAISCQCGATVVTIKQEMGRWSYALFVFGYMGILAYILSMIVYQLFSRLGF